MAKKPSPAAAKKKGKGFGLIALPLLGLGLWQLSYALVLMFGLLPSLIAWLADRDRNKLTAINITALNTAAVVPLLLRVWDEGAGISDALGLLATPFSWALILVGVTAGWILAQGVPSIIVGLILAHERAQVSRMRERQKHLIEEWGSDVAGGTDQR